MLRKYLKVAVTLITIIALTFILNANYKRRYIQSVVNKPNYDYTLSATQLDLKLGSIFSVYATGNDAPKVQWYSSDTDIAFINKTGQVVTKNIGQTIVTAKINNECKDIIINVSKSAKQDVLIYQGPNSLAASTEALNKININTNILTLSKNKYRYTGKKIKPKVSVVASDGTKLIENKDFVVKYQNNKKVGFAKVLITGIGDYTGSIIGTFQIITSESNNVEESNDSQLTSSTSDSTSSVRDNSSNDLTPTLPENSKVSSTRTQSYTSSSKKSNNSASSNGSSSKTNSSSSPKTTGNSSIKKESSKKETTKNSFTTSKSSTSKNSFTKSSSSSGSKKNSSSSNSSANSDTSTDSNSSSSSTTDNSTTTNSSTTNQGSTDSTTQSNESTDSTTSTAEQ